VDSIIVLAGGFTADGELPAWCARSHATHTPSHDLTRVLSAAPAARQGAAAAGRRRGRAPRHRRATHAHTRTHRSALAR
jgi:hypothetical protein